MGSQFIMLSDFNWDVDKFVKQSQYQVSWLSLLVLDCSTSPSRSFFRFMLLMSTENRILRKSWIDHATTLAPRNWDWGWAVGHHNRLGNGGGNKMRITKEGGGFVITDRHQRMTDWHWTSHASEPYIPIKPYRCPRKWAPALYSLYSRIQALFSPLKPYFLRKTKFR